MKKPIIELHGVRKIYTMGAVKVEVLRGVDLKVYPGEFLAIMGPSGSGKSTLMNLIGCLDVPSFGKILLDGHDIAKLHESELARIRGRKIGFVFQNFNLIGTMTALENVALPMVFQGIDANTRTARAEKLLEAVNLKDRMHHKPTELSGGQQQRVAIARALVNNPEVILADEPTGNLDSKTGAEIASLLEKLNRDGKTIVVITHDEDVAEHAKRMIHLKDGLIIKGEKNVE